MGIDASPAATREALQRHAGDPNEPLKPWDNKKAPER
jgi:hypothetical protein